MRRSKIAAATLSVLYAAGIGALLPVSAGNSAPAPTPNAIFQAIKPLPAATDPKRRRLSGSVNTQREIDVARGDRLYKAGAGETKPTTFIVILRDQPIATYEGNIAGLTATNPRAAKTGPAIFKNSFTADNRLDVKSEPARAYRDFLLQKHDTLQAKAGARGITMKVQQHYTASVNGMAAMMTPQAAEALAKLPEVRRVYPARTFQLNTDFGPQFIGADKLWDGSVTGGSAYRGEGMIAGIIDTGINYQHPSFAAVGGDGYRVVNPLGAGVYLGDCAADASLCNDKLIGIRSYPEITGTYADPVFQATDENGKPYFGAHGRTLPKNGMDYNGHGSHTASTVAGNVLLDVPYQGMVMGDGHGIDSSFAFPRLSGMAPHANIIAYQVCWPGNQGDPYAGCPETATLKAIDDAVADGVDTINFSIGGREFSPWDDATELAFLGAREAGISVAVAAGNSGRNWYGTGGTLGHSSPWEMVVAASTHGRHVASDGKSLTAMSGGDTAAPDTLIGQGVSDGASGEIVWAGLLPDPDPSDDIPAERCAKPWPAGSLTGKIVVCDRGVEARMTKALNVAAGDAAGFVLRNTDPGTDDLVGDVLPLPGIHVNYNDGEQLVTWLQSGTGHQATLTGATVSLQYDGGDTLAEFSSRGPSNTVRESLVPHVSAPGVDVYAAFSDQHPFTVQPGSADFALLSGTSMASPHTAGAATLLRQAHPDWTPAEVQSALTSTAETTVKVGWYTGPVDADIYDNGSGRINAAKAVRAGLILDESAENFRNANPDNGGTLHRLNLAQLANFHCRESCTWLRTVEATADGTWDVSAEVPASVRQTLSISPARFTLKKGQKQALTITATVTGTAIQPSDPLSDEMPWSDPYAEWHGKLLFTPTDTLLPTQHWPVAVAFDNGALPNHIDTTTHRNQGDYALKNLRTRAYTALTARAFGLIKGTRNAIALKPDHDPWGNWYTGEPGAFDDLNDGVKLLSIDVPENTAQLVVDSVDFPVTPIDSAPIYVGLDVNGDGQPQWAEETVCQSTSPIYQNFCVINNPRAGHYWIVVHYFDQSYGPWVDKTAHFTVNTAIVPKTDSGNLRVAGPASYDGSQPLNLNLHWDTPDAVKGDIYYGAFDLGSDANNPGNIGHVPVKLVRGENDVSVSASQTRAKPGDVVHYTVSVLPNLSGSGREFSLRATVPDGLKLLADTARLMGNVSSAVVVDGQTLSLGGTQADTSAVPRSYAITTSVEDASCRTDERAGGKGGFIDLNNFGDFRWPSISGGLEGRATIAYSQISPFPDETRIPLFNSENNTGLMTISPTGMMFLDDNPYFSEEGYRPMADPQAKPYELLSPFQIGAWGNPYFAVSNIVTRYGVNADGQNTGVSVATAGFRGPSYPPDALLIQWSGSDTFDIAGCEWSAQGCTNPDQGNSFNYEIWANTAIDFSPGKPEIIFAYGQMKGAISNTGVVGLRGFVGPSSWYGPVNPPLTAEYAYDNLASKLKPDTLVCYDYHGPEEGQFSLSFDARVAEAAAGTVQTVTIDNEVTGTDNVPATLALTINGNIEVGAIADQTTAEDTPINGISVHYVDADDSVNTISVSGAHVTAVVHGDTSGSTFDLIPDPDFNGATTVTVTVADKAYPSDAASTTFTLKVTPVADTPMAKASAGASRFVVGDTVVLDGSTSIDPDGGTLSYAWQQVEGASLALSGASLAKASVTPDAAGSYAFELTVDNGHGTAKTTLRFDVVAADSNPSNPSSPSTPSTPSTPGNGGGGGGAGGELLALLGALTLLRRRLAR